MVFRSIVFTIALIAIVGAAPGADDVVPETTFVDVSAVSSSIEVTSPGNVASEAADPLDKCLDCTKPGVRQLLGTHMCCGGKTSQPPAEQPYELWRQDLTTAKLDPISLPDWKHQSLVAKFLDVYIVVVKIQELDSQCTVPFYKSSGEYGEKVQVPKGRWYPFYGIGISPEKEYYFNKGSMDDVLKMPHPLKAVADALNDEFGKKASDQMQTEKKLQQLHRHLPGEVTDPKSAMEYMNKKIGDDPRIVGAEFPWSEQLQGKCLGQRRKEPEHNLPVCDNFFNNMCRLSFNMLHILKCLDHAYQGQTLYKVILQFPLGESLLATAKLAFPRANDNQIEKEINKCEQSFT
jgi:hypothetical protein